VKEHTLFWFSFSDRDKRRWKVFLATPHLLNKVWPRPNKRTLNGIAGITLTNDRHILIDAAPPRHEQDETLLHEVMHATFTGHNDNAAKAARVSHEAEERAIAAFSPRLFPILKRKGLRWPARPASAPAFEREARKLAS
jgi:hypothetical protein